MLSVWYVDPKYRVVTEHSDFEENLADNCLFINLEAYSIDKYEGFLQARREQMADKTKSCYLGL